MNSMYLAVGYNCNHYCYFCPCGKEENKAKAAPTEQIIQAIKDGMSNNGVEYVTLSGGEPTLHPGFHDVLKFCVESRLKVTVLTNGDTLYNENNVHKYFDGVNPRYFSIITAIHSNIPRTHDKVTGSKGSHSRTVDGLKNLIPLHIPFTVKQVISKWNYRLLPDFIDFVFREFGSFASLTLCGMDFCGMDETKVSEVGVSYKEFGRYLEQALDKVLSIRKQFGGFPQVTVTDLPLCCVDPYYWGFFTKVSRRKISQYSAPQKIDSSIKSDASIANDCDIYFKECSLCCVADYCPGVWSSAYKYFGESAVTAIIPQNRNDAI